MATQTPHAGKMIKASKESTPTYIGYYSMIQNWFKVNICELSSSDYLHTHRNGKMGTISDCIIASLKDSTFATTLSSSWLFFIIIQKVGEKMYNKFPFKNKKEKDLRLECGSYFESITHSLIFIPACLLIANPKSQFFQHLYKLSCVYSSAYFVNMAFVECFIPQTWAFRLLMVVHHIFCGLAQFPVYHYGGITPLISALSLQCEISNLFLGISWFAEQFDCKRIHKLAGVGILITFPITRCVILPIGTYKLLKMKDGVVPSEYYKFCLCGQAFVIIMSSVYSAQILWTPDKVLKMNTNDDEKSIVNVLVDA